MARYGDTFTSGECYEYDGSGLAGLGPADLINAVRCYQYQSCEHSNHANDLGWRISEEIFVSAANALVRATPHKLNWEFNRGM